MFCINFTLIKDYKEFIKIKLYDIKVFGHLLQGLIVIKHVKFVGPVTLKYKFDYYTEKATIRLWFSSRNETDGKFEKYITFAQTLANSSIVFQMLLMLGVLRDICVLS